MTTPQSTPTSSATTKPTPPRGGAEALLWSVISGSISLALFYVAGLLADSEATSSKYYASESDGSTTVVVFGFMLAALTVWLLATGVYRLAAHADRAAVRAWQAEQDAS